MAGQRVLVIGGGPGGLFAAIAAAAAGAAVTLLERNARPGAKLLLSGAGQCNCTHAGRIEDFFDHYGDHGAFLHPALTSFSNLDLGRFFDDRGAPCLDRGDGKVFPASGRADTLLTALEAECRKLGVDLRTRQSARQIDHDTGQFSVVTDAGRHPADRVVLATGGRSYPGTGSTGDGYTFATALGHTIVEPRPALCGVLVKDHWLAPLSGMPLPGATVTVLRGGRRIGARTGDALVTPWGLSGPAVLDCCRWLAPGDGLSLAPGGLAAARLADLPGYAYGAAGKRSLGRVVHECGLPIRLADLVCTRAGLDPSRRAAEVGKKPLVALAAACADLRVAVAGPRGWDEAMVTAGGVALEEVDPATMGSRLVAGLYFAGEVLDVDGDTGGYNIQGAASTGWLAGTSAARP